MNRIKQLRETRNVRQLDLSKHLQVSQGTLSNWERGVHDPDNESLNAIADFFGVSTDYLLGRTEDSSNLLTSEKKDSIRLEDISFALYGKVKELDDEDKEELLKYAKLMREMQERRKQRKK